MCLSAWEEVFCDPLAALSQNHFLACALTTNKPLYGIQKNRYAQNKGTPFSVSTTVMRDEIDNTVMELVGSVQLEVGFYNTRANCPPIFISDFSVQTRSRLHPLAGAICDAD